MTILLFLIGLALLLVLLLDVHMTVFVPRGGAGIMSRRLYSGGWAIWNRIGQRMPEDARRRWLTRYGPLVVPVTVLIWGTLLIAAFALMYSPWAAGFSVSPTDTGPMTDWAKALYYSGYAAVTLGVGDVVPGATPPRIMVFIQAGLGFALFTASISYLLSIYNARNVSITFALLVAYLTGREQRRDPVELLIESIRSSSSDDLTDWMEDLSSQLAALIEVAGEYPQLHYFHEPQDARVLPLALRDVLETMTVARSLLDPVMYPTLADGPNSRTTYHLGLQYLREVRSWEVPDSQAIDRARICRYEASRHRLEKAGLSLRDEADARQRFLELCGAWDWRIERMCRWLGYQSSADGA